VRQTPSPGVYGDVVGSPVGRPLGPTDGAPGARGDPLCNPMRSGYESGTEWNLNTTRSDPI